MKTLTTLTALTALSILIATVSYAQTYTVERVIDCNTLKLTSGEEVRLIGIKCSEDEKMGQRAAEKQKSIWLDGNKVYLEFDVQERDKYGRLLAYVFRDMENRAPKGGYGDFKGNFSPHGYLPLIYYFKNDKHYVFMNATMIKSGYATPITIPPNIKHAELFKELYEEARKQKRGLWKDKLSNSYFEDSLYCERDEDCSIREGACGPRPMNIHFDNKKLLEMSASVDCMEPVSLTNPRCEDNKCVADAV